MKTPLLIVALGAGIAMTALPADARGGGDKPEFSELDANGDGSVTLEEIQAFGEAVRAERFAEADADGDGALSEDELTEAGQARRVSRMIERFDANGDGMLQEDEIQAREGRAERMFDRLDADEDGVISEEEFANAPSRGDGERKRDRG